MNHHALIKLYLDSASQLLLMPGTSFYGKRQLKEYAEEYIVEQAELLPRRVPIHLLVELPAAEIGQAQDIITAVNKHFAYLREKSERKLKRTLQLGCRNLGIAIVFLGILVLLVKISGRLMPEGSLATTIRESLIILGWVALWHPSELLLYDWFPYKREAHLFRRLENSSVQVIEKGTLHS